MWLASAPEPTRTDRQPLVTHITRGCKCEDLATVMVRLIDALTFISEPGLLTGKMWLDDQSAHSKCNASQKTAVGVPLSLTQLHGLLWSTWSLCSGVGRRKTMLESWRIYWTTASDIAVENWWDVYWSSWRRWLGNPTQTADQGVLTGLWGSQTIHQSLCVKSETLLFLHHRHIRTQTTLLLCCWKIWVKALEKCDRELLMVDVWPMPQLFKIREK